MLSFLPAISIYALSWPKSQHSLQGRGLVHGLVNCLALLTYSFYELILALVYITKECCTGNSLPSLPLLACTSPNLDPLCCGTTSGCFFPIVDIKGGCQVILHPLETFPPPRKWRKELFKNIPLILVLDEGKKVSMADTALISGTDAWKCLKEHVAVIDNTHLRDLLKDEARCESMIVEFDGIILDYSRQRVTQETVEKLFKLAEVAHLKEKIDKMYNGEHINITENRSVLHIALRATKDMVIKSDGKNIVPDVWKVLDKINEFSDRVRSGAWVGATGKLLKDVVAVGIGGSFLGPLFVHTALQTDPEAAQCARGRQLRLREHVYSKACELSVE
eukprot:Gb_18195 [translate_table: standard]